MRRPLIAVALLYVAGILIGGVPVPLAALFALAFGVGISCLCFARIRLVLLGVLLVLAGWINLAQRVRVVSPNDLRALLGGRPEIAGVHGELCETPVVHVHHDKDKNIDTFTTTAQVDVAEVRLQSHGPDWRPAYGRITVTTRGRLPPDFFGGQTVRINGTLQPVPGPMAEGLFDYQSFLAHQGIYCQLRVERLAEWQVLKSPAARPLADRFRDWAKKTLAAGLPGEDLPLYLEWALTLGWKPALTEEVSEPFIQAATFHIFAVDGLRIAIVSGIFLALFRALSVPRAVAGLLTIPIIVAYAALTGWPASAIRAIVMAIVVFGGWALNRPSDLINSLFAAAILILTWDPRQLYQAGFQLSFVVVLCIILIIPLFERVAEWITAPNPLVPDSERSRWWRWTRAPIKWVVDLLLISVAAWLGSVPLAAWYFHIFTPGSGPANVLAVPLCGLVLICNLCGLLFAWFPFLSELFNHAGWLLMNGILKSSEWSADWPGAYYYVPMPGFFAIALYYLILIGLFTGWLFKGRARRWKIGGVLALIVVWVGMWLSDRSVTRVTVLPLEGGHAIYVQGAEARQDWLIDCGSEYSFDNIVKPYLRAQGVNRLSNFLLTHGEINYTGGARGVRRYFHPVDLFASGLHFRSPLYNEFQADGRGGSERRTSLRLGDHPGPFAILHPGSEDHFSKAEDNALVLRAEFAGLKILLLSDLGRVGQNALLSRTNDLGADVVVGGLPSEGEPLSDTIIKVVHPKIIVIADADYPATRRAGSRLHERLAAAGIPVVYTSDSRAVTIELRGGSWRLRAMDGTRFPDISTK